MSGTPIRDQRRGDRQINTANFNRIATAARGWADTNFIGSYFHVQDIGLGRRTIGLAVSAIYEYILARLMEKIAFGYKINQGSGHVTIYAGRVATLNDSQAVSQTNVTINGGTAANPHWVYLRFNLTDLTSAELPTPALATYPETTQTFFQCALYGFSKQSGIIRLEKIANLGDVVAPIRI